MGRKVRGQSIKAKSMGALGIRAQSMGPKVGTPKNANIIF